MFRIKIATSAAGSNAAFQIRPLFVIFEVASFLFHLFLNHPFFTDSKVNLLDSFGLSWNVLCVCCACGKNVVFSLYDSTRVICRFYSFK